MRPPGDAWVRNRLIGSTAALFGLRLLLSLVRTGPLVVADEIGYLTNARVLSGGLPGQLTEAEFYRGGYSLLLTPLLKLTSDPSTAYHLVLALNAVLAASLVPFLYLLLTQGFRVAPRAAVWAALAGAAYPSVTVYSQLALSENALFPLVCLWLLAVGGLLRVSAASAAGSRRAGWLAAGCGTCAAALWAVHGSMVVVPGLSVALGGWLVARRRIEPWAFVVLLAVLAVGLLGTHVLDDYLVKHNYGGHDRGGASDRLSALEGFHPLLTALGNLAGQLWYVLVATFGLLGIVVAWVRSPGSASNGRALGFWLLALTALLALVSAGAFPVRPRPDMLIYGRYLEVVAPPLVAVAVALLAERRVAVSPRLGAGALGVLTLLVVLVRMTSAYSGSASRFNVISLPFLTFQLGAGVLIGAAVVAGVAGWLVVRAGASSLGRVPAGLVTAVLFVPVIVYSVWNPVIQTQRSEYPSGWTSPERVASRLGIRTVGYDLSSYDEIGLYVTQWFLPHTRVELFDGAWQPPPGRYVISGSSWTRRHPSTAVWTDNGRDQLLWRLKGSGG